MVLFKQKRSSQFLAVKQKLICILILHCTFIKQKITSLTLKIVSLPDHHIPETSRGLHQDCWHPKHSQRSVPLRPLRVPGRGHRRGHGWRRRRRCGSSLQPFVCFVLGRHWRRGQRCSCSLPPAAERPWDCGSCCHPRSSGSCGRSCCCSTSHRETSNIQ